MTAIKHANADTDPARIIDRNIQKICRAGKRVKSLTVMLTCLTVVSLGGIASRLEAASILTVPTGLAPGSQYRLVFVTDLTYGSVTNGTYPVLSSAISTYNTDVANEAAQIPLLAALGATWSAIVSTDTVSAATNIGASDSSVGIYLLDGTTLIANGTGTSGSGLFSGQLLSFLFLTDLGTSANNVIGPLTGSHPDGSQVTGSALGDLQVERGAPARKDSGWITNGIGFNDANFNLYAISSTLTVPGATTPTPEPTTTALAALGLASLVATRRLRKQTKPSGQ
jgi:hypothetical protein